MSRILKESLLIPYTLFPVADFPNLILLESALLWREYTWDRRATEAEVWPATDGPELLARGGEGPSRVSRAGFITSSVTPRCPAQA